jgi:hypothetical protein
MLVTGQSDFLVNRNPYSRLPAPCPEAAWAALFAHAA